MADIKSNGQMWWAFSKKNKKFDVYGFTKTGDDQDKSALEAMEFLAKHLNEPIPTDIKLILLGKY